MYIFYSQTTEHLPYLEEPTSYNTVLDLHRRHSMEFFPDLECVCVLNFGRPGELWVEKYIKRTFTSPYYHEN